MNPPDTRVMTKETELASIDGAWEALRTSLKEPSLENRRGWLEIEARTQKGMMVVSIGQKGETRAIAPFLLRDWALQCRLGYRSVVSFPMMLARLCGVTLLAPADRALQESLFEAIAGAKVPYRTLFVESLAVESPLRKLIDESPIIKRHFWAYYPIPPAKHWLIRLPKTFAEYDSALGRKRRSQFKASEKKLKAACGGNLTIQRISSPDDLPAYFDAVEKLSKVSWQGRKLGQVMETDSDQARRIQDFAAKGWFRGYLLKSDAEPIAFVIGFQSDGVYDYMKIGYDPKWNTYSPGNVMLYRLIEDVTTHDRAEVIDLGGGDSQYKRVFGNDSYDEQNVYLFRRSAYTNVARVTHSAFVKATSAAREGLQKTGLLEAMRRVLRGSPKEGAGGEPSGESGGNNTAERAPEEASS